MNYKIAAVVVTFNRLELLKQCINSLRNQTHKLDEIIVVNNSSTDGTIEWLDEQNDLTVITQENSGSAGGQYSGIKAAYEKGYDWVLCTDDDSELQDNYLEILINIAIQNNWFFLAGAVKSDKDQILVNHRGYLAKKTIIKDMLQIPLNEHQYSKDYIQIDFVSFVGMLINRKIIEIVGFPNKYMFYQHDDAEYCLRINPFFSGWLITKAIIIHKENPTKAFNRFSDFAERMLYPINPERLFYDNRNLTYLINRFYKNYFVKLLSILNLLFVNSRRIILYSNNKVKFLRILFFAFFLGLNENFRQYNEIYKNHL